MPSYQTANMFNTNSRAFIQQQQQQQPWYNYPNQAINYAMLNPWQSRMSYSSTNKNNNNINNNNSQQLLATKTIKTNANTPKYEANLDIMADSKSLPSTVDDTKKSKIIPDTHEIVKKMNIPLSPTKTKIEKPNSVETRKEKDQIMSEIDVQPLTEFPTDSSDEPHALVEKDAIPRPEDLQPHHQKHHVNWWRKIALLMSRSLLPSNR